MPTALPHPRTGPCHLPLHPSSNPTCFFPGCSRSPPLPQGSRYDDNIAVFGRSLQAKIESLKIFLVGGAPSFMLCSFHSAAFHPTLQ